MTDSAFETPSNVADVDETVRHVKNSRVELFGGPYVALVLALLLIVFLVLDTFGLNMLMAQEWLHPSAPMMFRDICIADAPARSGGFALGFVLILGAALVVSHFLAPRSVAYGFGFFLVTATFGQWYIANNGSIDNVMGFRLISGLWNARIECDAGGGGSLKSLFNYWYNPVFDRGPSDRGNAGVPVRFTTMLVANLGVLTIFVALAAVALLVAAIVRFFRKPAKAVGPIGGIFGLIVRGPVDRAMIIQTAVLTVLAVIAGPMLILLFAVDEQSGRGGADVTESIHDLLWIGPVVFLADLARVALWSPEPEAEGNFVPVETAPDTPLILQDMLVDLRTKEASQIPVSYTLGANPKTTPVSGHMTSEDFSKSEDVPVAGTGNLHFETLTNWHYDLIIETMNRRVFDRGRTALVICPVDVIADVRQALQDGLAQNPGVNVVNWWCYGDELPKNDVIEMILVSPESLEALVAEVFSHQEFFRLLGGMFVLNLHRMDLGLLHVSLKRMERYVGSSGDMVAILQSEFRRKMPDWSKNLPLLVTLKDIRPRTRPAINEAIPQHIAFLTPRADENFKAGRFETWPIGLRALVQASKLDDRALPYLFDIHTEHVGSFWSDKVIQSLRDDGDDQTIDWAKQFRAPALVPENHPHPVAQLSDRSNLVNILGSDIGSTGALEALRLISVGGYPGASFLLDRVTSELGGATTDADRRHALTQLQNTLASIAPAPQGGPIELALMVRQEFMSATRARVGETVRQDRFKTLTQERISAFWDHSSPALKQLRISNTKAGLEKLFRISLQPQESGEMLYGHQTEQRSYEFTLTELATRNIDALAMLELSIQDPNRALDGVKRPERLLLADHGLSYAKGTRLALGGRIYEVIDVMPRERRLQVRYSEETPAFPNTFVRDYAILTKSQDDSGFAADGMNGWMTRRIPHEIAFGYLQVARTTRATFQHSNLWKPFAGLQSVPFRSAVNATSPLQIRSSAILRLLIPEQAKRKGRTLGASSARLRRATSDVSGQLAFTLATTLQDVLQMCFPANAHRIAVLCPQSAMPAQSTALEQFASQRQPGLRSLDHTTKKITAAGRADVDHGLDPQEIKSHVHLAEQFFERTGAGTQSGGKNLPSSMQFFILEDGDHDLGVAKALSQSDIFASVLDFWTQFVGHCAKSGRNADTAAYAFGAGKIADCYDFDGALDVLKQMSAEVD